MAVKLSFEGKAGLVVGLVGLMGAGAIIVRPEQHFIGWTLIAAAGVGAAALAIGQILELLRGLGTPNGRRKMIAFLGMAISGVALVASAFFYFWPSKTPSDETPRSHLKETGDAQDVHPEAPAPQSSRPSRTEAATKGALPSRQPGEILDHTVELACDWVQPPDVIPAGGWHELGATLSMGIMHGGSSFSPGSPNNQKGTDFPRQTYVCRFTNYGDKTVLNVHGELSFHFFEVVPQESGSHSGNLIKSETASTPPANLRPAQTFDFYVRNYSYKAYVVVTPPTKVRLQVVGSDVWRDVALVAPGSGDFSLGPFTEKRIE